MCRLQCLLISVCCFFPTHQVLADEVADLVALLQSDDSKVRYDAARSLGKLGQKAEPAIKPLVAALSDYGPAVGLTIQYLGPRVRDAASDALVRIGRPAVPSLTKALSHEDKATREMAAKTLGQLGPVAKDSYAALMETLTDGDVWVRRSAIRAIGRVGTEPNVVVPQLERTFRRRNEERLVRSAALKALHDADPAGTMAIPLLTEALKEPDGDIMSAAAQTLGKFGPKASFAVPKLIEALSTDKRRWHSYFHFGYTIPVRIDLVRTLADIGPGAAIAVPTLTELMTSDEDKITRIWAAAALVRIAPEEPAAERGFALLGRTLRGEANSHLAEAAKALGTIGSEAAIVALIEALNTKDTSEFGSLHQSAAEALGQIGPPAKAAVVALRNALSEETPGHMGVRREAVRALGKIGPAGKSAIPDLNNLRKSDDRGLRELAIEAVERIVTQPVELDIE